MREPIAFLNGRWIPASAAAVPVTDAGFVQGTAVAEQLRTFRGTLFHLEDHLARLLHSLEIIGVDPGMTAEQLAGVARELVAHNHAMLPEGDDLGLSIFVTPGTYRSYASPQIGWGSGTSSEAEMLPAVARETAHRDGPLVCLHTYPLPFHLWADKYEQGQSLVTTDVEQVSQRSWPAGLKCRSRMHYHLADMQAAAIDPGARALLLDSHGFITEASTANVLIYTKEDGLASPPLGKILRGISLSIVWQLAADLDIAAGERELSTDDVASADEVFLTSTPFCLLPVVRLNGRAAGSDRPGPVFQQILSAWNKLVGIDIAEQARQMRRL